MAEIHVERKTGMSWVWWLVGVAVLALVIWVLVSMGHRSTEVAAVPVAPAVTAPATDLTPAGTIPVARILDDPAAWTGTTVTGDVHVVQVVSDRGFWVEDQGKRLFVVLNEVPGEIKEINAGQTIRLNDARVYDRAELGQVTGTLAPQARQIAENQPLVLAVDSQNVDVLMTGRS